MRIFEISVCCDFVSLIINKSNSSCFNDTNIVMDIKTKK